MTYVAVTRPASQGCQDAGGRQTGTGRKEKRGGGVAAGINQGRRGIKRLIKSILTELAERAASLRKSRINQEAPVRDE